MQISNSVTTIPVAPTIIVAASGDTNIVSVAPTIAAAAESTIGAHSTIIKKRKVSAVHSGKALYLFAGPKRKSSISFILRSLGWEVVEIDIWQGGKAHDLTRACVRNLLLDKVDRGAFDLLLTSPPCDTFTRVKFAND